MKKTLRVDMVTRLCVYVAVDEEKYENGDIDLAEEIGHYLNCGNWARHWELEDPDKGVVEVDVEPDFEIE